EPTPLEGNSSNIFSKNNGDPFGDTFPDPLCKLNLKETSDFVKAFPMSSTSTSSSSSNNSSTETRGLIVETSSLNSRRDGVISAQQRRLEAPSTPGRPVFSFNVGNLSRKSFPSKWDDAEKWLISSSCHESPAHILKPHLEPSKVVLSKQHYDVFQPKGETFAEKARVNEDKVSRVVSSFQRPVALDPPNSGFNGGSAEVLLKDKFTDNVDPIFPNFRFTEPSKEGFLFRNSACEAMKDAATKVFPQQAQHRDIGTEMTPLGSSTTSRCHTPFKTSSPARHNTPADRSGPIGTLDTTNTNNSSNTIDISELQECHFAKLELGTQFDSVVSNWSSREEEEEEISKSLRHFEKTSSGCRKNIMDYRASVREEEEKAKSCIRLMRYRREEAKIQAWVNLQSAKAEAQSRKLEVKIQKMKSNLEEKLMKRMCLVHRKAEELRLAAQLQHSQQIQRGTEQQQQTQRIKNPHHSCISDHTSCGCFPCSNHHHI
ncbi:hypothetical protein GIB67_009648, partial [Kingdonia uniflora]